MISHSTSIPSKLNLKAIEPIETMPDHAELAKLQLSTPKRHTIAMPQTPVAIPPDRKTFIHEPSALRTPLVKTDFRRRPTPPLSGDSRRFTVTVEGSPLASRAKKQSLDLLDFSVFDHDEFELN